MPYSDPCRLSGRRYRGCHLLRGAFLKKMALGQPSAPVDPTERPPAETRNLQTMLDRLLITFTRCDACQVLAVPIQAAWMDDKDRD